MNYGLRLLYFHICSSFIIWMYIFYRYENTRYDNQQNRLLASTRSKCIHNDHMLVFVLRYFIVVFGNSVNS